MTRLRALRAAAAAAAAFAAGSSAPAAAQAPAAGGNAGDNLPAFGAGAPGRDAAAPAAPARRVAVQVITGRVTDSASAAPLAGVTVSVVGTRLGAVTNAEGRYTIAGAPPGPQTLRAVRIGYAPQTRTVTVVDGQNLTADFALRTQATQLAAVVAVGYGTQSTRNVTGAVANVNTERLERLPVPSIDQALAGQVAGVQVLQSNGVPGGGPQIQIRGVGAIGAGNQPLYVVDGFPLATAGGEVSNPLADLPPQDIASVSVLKDASAAAIYGSRAANGVVIITTKTGRNQAPRVQLNYSAGVQQAQQRYRPDMMNAREFAQFRRESYEDQARLEGRAVREEDIPAEYRNPAAYGEGTSWYDEIVGPAPIQDLVVNASGGTANISAYASAGYFRQEGLVQRTDFERFSGRANVSADVSRRLRVGANLAPTYSRRVLPVAGGTGRGEDGGLGQALIASPLLTPRDSTGAYRPTIVSPGMISLPNPLLALSEIDTRTSSFRGLGTAFAEYALLDGLRLRATANVDVQNGQSQYFRPSTVGGTAAPPPRVPFGSYSSSNVINWLAENTLTYNRQFAGRHTVDVVTGVSVQRNTLDAGGFSGTNYPDDDIQTLNAAAQITGGTNGEAWGLLSYLGRVNYSFGDRYLLSAALRTDGSSRFAPGNRWGTFPSASLGWRLSEEPFMPKPSWLGDVKLRVSYGQTGNLNIGNFDYVGRVAASNYVLANALGSGRFLQTLGNPELGWEKTQEFNAGLDVGLFRDRVTFSLDAYQGDTKDLLLGVELPPSSGFSSVTRNTGGVRNRGIEAVLRTTNVSRGSLQWSTDFNVAVNRNRVLALGPTGAPIRRGSSGENSPTHITQVGQPVGMFYGYVFQGLYRDSAEIRNGPNYPGAVPGSVKYKDVNGDGLITPISDFEIIGNPYPDATFGINNTLAAGRFGLTVLMAGQIGGEKLKGFNEYFQNIDGVFNVSRNIQNRWRSPEQPGDGRTPTTAGGSRGRVLYRDVNSQWVQDATHLSVRNVTLNYRLPARLLGPRAGNSNVYFGVQNAFMFSRYPGNPEVTNYNRDLGPLQPGYDAVPYPVPRTFTLGTQLGF